MERGSTTAESGDKKSIRLLIVILMKSWVSNNFFHSPKAMFKMRGGEGSTAREALKHKSIEKVIMCDIDQGN
ncbi:hypothetical protein LXL04_016528 [Taraxacum kok-saghyz]